MSPEVKMLLSAGIVVALPFALGLVLEEEQKTLAKDLTIIGLVGTVVGVPLGLLVVPNMSTLGAASVLTLAGLGVKFLLLSHEEPQDYLLPEMAV